jgi:hypothetical protein
VAWPLAILFHLAGNSGYLALLLNGSVLTIALVQLLVVGAIVAMLARPTAPIAVILATGFVLLTWLKAPRVGNHEVILALMCLVIVLSAIRADDRWLNMAVPALRWLFIIAYGSIAFSKLNTGFLDPSVSCAVIFGDEMGSWVNLHISGNTALSWLAIVATVIIELAIPIMLVVSRWRPFGVLLGMVFHLGLALDPASHVYDFTSTLYPLFLLFTPVEFQQELSNRIDRARARLGPRSMAMAGALAVGLHGLTLIWDWPRWLIAYPVWLVLSLGVIAGTARFVRASRRSEPAFSARPIEARVRWPLGLILVLAVLNGAAPYLELRTAAAFNMYANLETVDGRSNHLVVRRTWPLRSQDLVVIENAPDDHPMAYYVGRDIAVPLDNLRHHRNGNNVIGDDQVSLGPSGDFEALPASLAAVDPAGNGWLATVAHKLGYRRSVDLKHPTRCQREWGPTG